MKGVVVEVRSLCKSFPGKSLFTDMSVTFPPGKITALLGLSGVGKSTLLRIIAGAEAYRGGSILIDGIPHEAYAKRYGIGFAGQEPALLPWRSSVENVALPLEIRRRGDCTTRHVAAVKALGDVGLSTADHESVPSALSGGMKQRVSLARAFAVGSQLVLLDEPLSNLDENSRENLCALIRSEWQKTDQPTVIVVTHDTIEAAYISDYYAALTGPMAGKLSLIDNAVPEPRSFGDVRLFNEARRIRSVLEASPS